MTIEDPIEFLHRDKKSLVNQREVEVDTKSFAYALRSALRQDPDVILVGEMRDYETIETALNAAETGHLVLSTLHTVDATETINRVISVFPPHQQKQVRLQLGAVLQGDHLDAPGAAQGRQRAACRPSRCCARRPYIRDCIENKEKTKLIQAAIAAGTSQYGMQTFDQSLYNLYKADLISYEEALRQATQPGRVQAQGRGHPVDVRHGHRRRWRPCCTMHSPARRARPARPGFALRVLEQLSRSVVRRESETCGAAWLRRRPDRPRRGAAVAAPSMPTPAHAGACACSTRPRSCREPRIERRAAPRRRVTRTTTSRRPSSDWPARATSTTAALALRLHPPPQPPAGSRPRAAAARAASAAGCRAETVAQAWREAVDEHGVDPRELLRAQVRRTSDRSRPLPSTRRPSAAYIMRCFARGSTSPRYARNWPRACPTRTPPWTPRRASTDHPDRERRDENEP